MKNKKILLILSLILILSVVFAITSDSDMSIFSAFLVEAFVSIHMSIFFLWPLSKLISDVDSKKNFLRLFIIRIAILVFFDLFVTTNIALFDFAMAFIGAFIIIPILSLIKIENPYEKNITEKTAIDEQKSDSVEKCPKCGGVLKPTDKYCQNCGMEINLNAVNENKKIVEPKDFDLIYNYTEDKLLEEFIKREMEKVGFEKNSKLIPKDILKRKNILSIIFSVLLFTYIFLVFFHFPSYTYILGLIILVIFFRLTRKYNLMKYLEKEIKSRPNEKISNILMSVKNSFVDDNKVLRLSFLIFAIVIPLIIFMNPKIMYEHTDNGYAVRFYTFGWLNYKTATIPEKYKGENVVSLRGNTFSNMPFLERVSLPNTIIEIRGQAFKNDKRLVDVNIPNNLVYLGGGAFYNCTSLKKIEFPDTVTFIGGESFHNASSLESVKLSNNITEIRGNTFEYCSSLKSINIPDSVTRIGGHAFYGCSSLSSVILTPNSKLQEIGSSAFRRCYNLYEITLPKGVYINERAFKESSTYNIYYFD